ncbi:hypothetical protein PVK06_033464 [Gossypium arboreum]|uniref:Uncharacterized protein n=1 Tax=Gossypium arboreum TaxID=29729 RepID=A0ABR0NBG5_GOSAR|nr:hypothetical protein PVK06_033464 [Gossypium arboreum]
MGIKPWMYWNVFEEIDKQVEDIGVVSFVNAFRKASRKVDTLTKAGSEKSNMFMAYRKCNLGVLVSRLVHYLDDTPLGNIHII